MKSDYLFKTKPYDHQYERFMLDRDKEFFAYLWEMGAGKSKIILDTAAWLYMQGRIDMLLIVAPNGIHRNWIRIEAPTHLPDHVNYRGAFWVPKSKQTKKVSQQMTSVFNHADGLRVFSVNIDALSMKQSTEMVKATLQSFRCLMVIDESTTIKSHDATRTKNILKIGIHAKYRRILTGTPITKNPLDIFTQFSFLDDHILRTQSYYAFRGSYAVLRDVQIRTAQGTRNFKTVEGFQNLDRLNQLIAPYSHRVTKDECLDLPEKIYMRRPVDLTEEQITVYTQMRDELIVEFNEHQVTAQLAIVRMLRLQQIVGGFLGGIEAKIPDLSLDQESEHGDGLEAAANLLLPKVRPLDSNRIAAMIEAIEEIDGKVIIWSRFVAEIEAITKALEKQYGHGSVVQYYGAVSNDDREEAIAKFQGERRVFNKRTGELERIDKVTPENQARFFVGNAQAAGMGLTLTAATYVIYYSNNFNYADRLQSEDRAHRIGQHFPVTYIDLVAEGTIDEHIIEALRTKQDFARMITGDAWKQWI